MNIVISCSCKDSLGSLHSSHLDQQGCIPFDVACNPPGGTIMLLGRTWRNHLHFPACLCANGNVCTLASNLGTMTGSGLVDKSYSLAWKSTQPTSCFWGQLWVLPCRLDLKLVTWQMQTCGWFGWSLGEGVSKPTKETESWVLDHYQVERAVFFCQSCVDFDLAI